MASVLPEPDEAPALIPRRGGPVWRTAGDVRMLAGAGYALVLQVAHPTVGAGVMEFSNFREDPWGRLLRTLDYVHGSIYGGPHLAAEIGRRVRDMHKTIKGTKPDGSRYHALEPDAYAWVHATLASAMVESRRRFARPMPDAEAEAFWQEWRRLGRLIGVRGEDLPPTWREFDPYFDRVIAEELQDNPTVHLVIETLEQPAPPPLPGLHPALWRAVRGPVARRQRMITIGMLPANLRERLNLPWSDRDERRFKSTAALSRASSPLIAGPLAEFGVHYVRARRKALERGDVARPRTEAAPRPATPASVA